MTGLLACFSMTESQIRPSQARTSSRWESLENFCLVTKLMQDGKEEASILVCRQLIQCRFNFIVGSVTADNGDGTYAVLFEDGCTDNAEPGSDIFPENAELPVEKALAGKIFVAQYESQANLKVYVTYSESLADLCVHKQDYESHADGNSGAFNTNCWS